jgi:hypothetical protein
MGDFARGEGEVAIEELQTDSSRQAVGSEVVLCSEGMGQCHCEFAR